MIVTFGIAFRRCRECIAQEACIGTYGGFDLVGDVRILGQEGLGVFTALANALVFVGEPGA